MDNTTNHQSQEEKERVRISLTVLDALQTLAGFLDKKLITMSESTARAYLENIAKKAKQDISLAETIMWAMNQSVSKVIAVIDKEDNWKELSPAETFELCAIHKAYLKLIADYTKRISPSPEGKQETIDKANLAIAKAKSVTKIDVEEIHVKNQEPSAYIKPLDKGTKTTFSPTKSKIIGESQEAAHIISSPRGAKKQVYFLLKLDFSDLDKSATLPKELTAYDRRIYEIIGSLVKAGNKYITAGMIYRTMTGTGRANSKQLSKIRDSVEKMRSTKVTIDNALEASCYNYKHFKYNSYLIPYASVEVINRGQTVDYALEVTNLQLPLIRFAESRKQIVTFPVKLLWSSTSNTEKQLELEDYILDRVARAQKGQNKNVAPTIILKTLFEKLNIKKDKKRTTEAAKRIFKNLKANNLIKSYAITEENITWEILKDPTKL